MACVVLLPRLTEALPAPSKVRLGWLSPVTSLVLATLPSPFSPPVTAFCTLSIFSFVVSTAVLTFPTISVIFFTESLCRKPLILSRRGIPSESVEVDVDVDVDVEVEVEVEVAVFVVLVVAASS